MITKPWDDCENCKFEKDIRGKNWWNCRHDVYLTTTNNGTRYSRYTVSDIAGKCKYYKRKWWKFWAKTRLQKRSN